MNETKTLISKFLLISLSMLLCSVVKAEEITILPFTKGTFVDIKNQHQRFAGQIMTNPWTLQFGSEEALVFVLYSRF